MLIDISRKQVKKYARSARPCALCGLTFFYESTLKRAWRTLIFVRPPREKTRTVLLRVDAVRTLLAPLQLLRSRVGLRTIYAWGLELRPLARAHPTRMDTLLLQTAAAALQAFALDPTDLGGPRGMVGVLHPWTRAMASHPPGHSLGPGGALSPDGSPWLSPIGAH